MNTYTKLGAGLMVTLALSLNSFGDNHSKPELSPLNVVGSNAGEPTLSSGLKSSLPIDSYPQGISVMSAEQIKLQGLKSVGDIIDYTPGVNNSQGEGHRDAAVIRGVRTTQDFYRDGIRDDVQYYRPLYNIEQVEVIRGPNALVSGFGGAYGFINRVSKKGVVGESFNSFSASVDTFGETLYQMDNNIELSDNTALRINMYGDNLENHRDYYYGDSFGVNPTLRMNLGDGSTLDLSYEYINQERFIDRGIPTGLDGRPVESLTDYVFADPVENFSNHEANFFKAIYEHEIADGLTGKLAFSHSDQDKLYKNVYVSGYFNSASQGFTTAALPIELDGYVDTTQRNSSIFSYSIEGEFETGSMVHNVFAAIEYTSTENNNDRYHADFDPSAADADWADEAIFALSRTILNGGFGTGQHENNLGTDAMLGNNYTTRRSDLTEGDLSVFSLTLQDEISFNDSLDVIVGARFDNMEYDVNSFDRSNVVTPLSDSDDTISPRIGVIYDLTEQATIYASYSESFAPAAGDQYASLNAGYADIDPSSFENTEFGFRYDLLNGLTLSASFFMIDASRVVEDPANPGTYIYEDSDTTGFEVQLQGSLTDNWFISAGYASLDAEDPDGDRVREAPENMLSVWNNYTVTDRFAVNLGVVYQDDSQIGSGTSPILPAYTRVDVGATMLVTDNTSIQLNIENVTDELYFPHSHSTHQASVGAPVHATFGITSSF